MHSTKPATAPCPSCAAPFCAEYVLLDGTARWSCHCGAGGSLTGTLSIRSRAGEAPAAPAREPHRHWSDRAKGTTLSPVRTNRAAPIGARTFPAGLALAGFSSLSQ